MRKIFAVLLLSLLTLGMLGLVTSLPHVKAQASDLPYVPHSETVSITGAEPTIFFDYTSDPAPSNYNFNVTLNYTDITFGSTNSLNFYVWDSSGDDQVFRIIYSPDESNTYFSIDTDGPTDTFYIGQNITSPIIQISKNNTEYFAYDENGTLLGSYTCNTEIVGFSMLGGDESISGDAIVSFNYLYTAPLTITYGFRVFVLHSSGTTTELTDGTPVAQVTRTEAGSGFQTATWTCPETNTILGYDAFKLTIYLSTDGGATWSARADYVSPVLITDQIEASTWTFTLWTNFTGSTTEFRFGNTVYKSGIDDITFSVPTESEIQAWRLSRTDLIGFLLGAYVDEIGIQAFYLLILVLVSAVMYFRYQHVGIIVFFFILFGGAGGLGLVFLANVPIAIAPTAALLILAFAIILWRILR